MKIETLQKKLEKTIQQYIEAFEDKHDCEFDFWVADKIGEIATFGDYFFDFRDIRADLEEDAPKYLIWEWYDEQIENDLNKGHSVSYETWLRRKK